MPVTPAQWISRAETLLESALDELRSGREPHAEIDAAKAALQIADGDLDATELDSYFPGDDKDGPACTCPPELAARGGWTSTCPACGTDAVPDGGAP